MEQRRKSMEEHLKLLQEEQEELQRAIYLCQEGRTAWVCVRSEYKGVREDVQVALTEMDLQLLADVRSEAVKTITGKY